ncbi:unnamed protein product [Chrysoparadoxa australica]
MQVRALSWGAGSSSGPRSKRIFSMATGLGRQRPVTAMAVLEPQFSSSGSLEVVLATADCDVVVAGETRVQEDILQEHPPSPFTAMAVAPNGRFLACFSEGGTLTVISSDFASKVMDFDTSTSMTPQQMVWCGEDSILLTWPGQGLLMVGPYCDWVRLPYSCPVFLLAESDCCRIITQAKCELLQRVPPALEGIERIGSTDPAALLFAAMEAFEEGDPKADETIRAMESEAVSEGPSPLTEAVQSCLAAAVDEFSPAKQKQLLRAASYGKVFLEGFNSDDFVDCCRKLRVLNNARAPSVGMPLTSVQYDRMTPEVLIQRLLACQQHLLAFKVCEALKIPQHGVVVDWACRRLTSPGAMEISDSKMCDMITTKLAPLGSVSYADIARTADSLGRRSLATLLLEKEPLVADQVPLLLGMKEHKLGLKKAIDSGDSDLVCLALLHLERMNMDRQQLYGMVGAHPEAVALLKAYYRSRCHGTNGSSEAVAERQHLHELCMFEGNVIEAGILAVQAACPREDLDDKIAGLREAVDLFGKSKDGSFMSAATKDQIELLLAQRNLETRTGLGNLTGRTLCDTIYELLIQAGQDPEPPSTPATLMHEANKLQQRFKVPEKRFWHIRIKAMAACGQWKALQALAAERKSPVGYKPFAAVAIKYERPPEEISGYVDRIVNADDRFQMLLDAGSNEKASEMALKSKDPRKLVEVRENLLAEGAVGSTATLLVLVEEALQKAVR